MEVSFGRLRAVRHDSTPSFEKGFGVERAFGRVLMLEVDEDVAIAGGIRDLSEQRLASGG